MVSGDWLLVFNYARSGRGDELLQSGVLPQSLTGFSHAFVADALPGLTKGHVVASKFFCQSSRHDRVVSAVMPHKCYSTDPSLIVSAVHHLRVTAL